jgi:hypothetical protein
MSFLGNLVHAAEQKIGQVYRNATATQHPVQTMSPQAQQAIQTAKYGVFANNPQAQQQFIQQQRAPVQNNANPYQQLQAAAQIVRSPFQPVINSGLANLNYGKGVVGAVTGNKKAMQNGFKAGNKNMADTVDIARQFTTRPVVQMAASLAPKQLTVAPTNPVTKALIGDTPVQNIQKGVISNYQQHPNLPLPARIGLAGAYGAGQIANDIPVAGGIAKGAVKGAKIAAPVVKEGAAVAKQALPNEAGAVPLKAGASAADAPKSRQVLESPQSITQPRLPASKGTSEVSLPNNTPKMSIPEDAPSIGMRQRGLATTIQNDVNTAPAVKAKIGEMYKVRNTKDLQTRAATLVKENPNLALRVFKSDSNSDVGTMIGGELSAHMSRIGQHETALEIAQQMAREATNRGQANQALSTWGKLAPESILRFAQSTVNDYNKSAGLAGGSKELTVTAETAKKLTKMSEDLKKMAPSHEKDIATQKMLNTVKELVPSSWVAKLSTLQTVAQLLNPKTLIRNIGGNTMFGGLENVSQTLAAGVDKTLSYVRGTPRQVALPNLKTQAKSALAGGKQQFKETTRGVNLGPNTQFDLADVPTFRKGFMAGVEKTMGVALRVPDRAALNAAVDDTVQGLMKANKLQKPTQEILDEAAATGLYRTFQDNSKAAQLFTGLKGALNIIGKEGRDGKRWGLGDLILKYPKTPGNILARGIDYSPLGIVKGLYEVAKPAIKGQPFNQRAFSLAVSRGTVGTGALMGTGAVLGALGIITEKPSQDTDTRNLQKASGKGGYQINTSALRRFITSGLDKDAAKLRKGDTLVSYDWAQPASIPLSAGAALGKGKSGLDGATSTLDNAASGLNSLVEQPLVTGVNTFATNIKNYGLVGAGEKAVEGAPASFVPTASNQVRQLTDNNTRSTYDPSMKKESLNMVLNRIPGADRTLPKRVGPLGEDLQNYQNGSNNVFNVAFNPAFVNKYQPNESADLPLNILQNSGETKQIPTTTKTSQKVNGANQKLTAKQNHDFQQFVGQQTKIMIDQRSKDPRFMALDDTAKANEISSRISDIQAAARVKVLGDTPSKTRAKAVDKVLTGNTVYTPKKPTIPPKPKDPHPMPKTIVTTYDEKTQTWTEKSTKTGRTTVISADGTRTLVDPGTGRTSTAKATTKKASGTSTKTASSSTKKTTTSKAKATGPGSRGGSTAKATKGQTIKLSLASAISQTKSLNTKVANAKVKKLSLSSTIGRSKMRTYKQPKLRLRKKIA